MTDIRERIEAAIKDAYYSARDNGGTMHTAATDATDAVLAILAEPDEATVERLAKALFVHGDDLSLDDEIVDRYRRQARTVLAALADTSAQARHTAGDATGGGEDG